MIYDYRHIHEYTIINELKFSAINTLRISSHPDKLGIKHLQDITCRCFFLRSF